MRKTLKRAAGGPGGICRKALSAVLTTALSVGTLALLPAAATAAEDSAHEDSARVPTQSNTPPDRPSNHSTSPSVPCAGGVIGLTTHVTLRAEVNDAEDDSLTAEFRYAPEGGPAVTAEVGAASGSVASVRIPSDGLREGVTYWWEVRAGDGTAHSPWTDRCTFSLDKERPSSPPGAYSEEFPEDRDGNPVRTEGEFTFTANGVDDVARYVWWTDSDRRERSVDADGPGGSATITHRPLRPGPQFLYVRSLDAAGNGSDRKSYLFYPASPPHRDRPGDLDGDSAVDLWLVDPDSGALLFHLGRGDGTFAPGRRVGDERSFGDAVITHRGTWNEDHYEDVVILRPGWADPSVKELWVHEGSGDGGLDGTGNGSWRLDVVDDADNHWADADQILSVGSLDDDDGDGRVDDNDAPDLLVKSGGELWLYFGHRGSPLIDWPQPVRLGGADWQDMTLLAPGDLNGDGLPELWARDTVKGAIHQYTSRPNPVADEVAAADLSVYADPAVRATSIGGGFTAAAYPHLSTNGDFEGDGFADLWARDDRGDLVGFSGRALADGSAFGPARPLVTGRP
ncbi:hypothetical protein V1L54_16425 [Streptomyces sp. TRM 70361]|uniref:hypothetical protein n=1 Tax=Streptomyces sp. TRM 70361 TaxID=3116553 RepID=UPI002E7B5A98|nr:hypothetical protein [Streptomyces sp. TRM 70361]MEE1940970.1 hypothetical protein [Streptomyces sp. TRM 70361]